MNAKKETLNKLSTSLHLTTTVCLLFINEEFFGIPKETLWDKDKAKFILSGNYIQNPEVNFKIKHIPVIKRVFFHHDLWSKTFII